MSRTASDQCFLTTRVELFKKQVVFFVFVFVIQTWRNRFQLSTRRNMSLQIVKVLLIDVYIVHRNSALVTQVLLVSTISPLLALIPTWNCLIEYCQPYSFFYIGKEHNEKQEGFFFDKCAQLASRKPNNWKKAGIKNTYIMWASIY